jgi:hypothetical protein
MDDFTFGVKDGGGADLVIDGETHEVPAEDGQPLFQEVETAQEPPVDPEFARLQAVEEEYEALKPFIRDAVQRSPEPAPVIPAPEDLAQYFERTGGPTGKVGMARVSAYAELLPEEERVRLDSDPRAYVEVFDKLTSTSKPAQPERPSKALIDSILRRKEVLIEAGRSERAGVHRDPPPPQDKREVAVAALKKKIRANPTDTSLARALASYYVDDL